MDSRAYIGQFSDNGQFFVVAFQVTHGRVMQACSGT
jgi:hypothetical protein